METAAEDPGTLRDSADDGRDTAGIGRVLVVDDSVLVRTIVSRILAREGFDGFDFLLAIRALAVPPEVVFPSGARADDFTAAVRALRLGAHGFLTKPSLEEDLVHAVSRAVETHRLKEENRRLLLALERETRTEPLTGAGNRRAFAETVRLEMSRSRPRRGWRSPTWS